MSSDLKEVLVKLVHLVNKVILVSKDLQESLDYLVLLEKKDLREIVVQLDLQVVLDHLVYKDTLDKEDNKAQLEL